MIEFGSDFHFCSDFYSGTNPFSQKEISLYANGRQPIQHLIYTYKWKRIWVPAYFCYRVIDSIKETGIEVLLYNDNPIANDMEVISKIKFQSDDVLLRINYFGLRKWRDNKDIPVPVIEDHSHDLISEWATKSNANWIIASLRKTLPLPEGGILWSPTNHHLPNIPESSISNELIFYQRISAMLLKKLYLSGNNISKDRFREIYLETEEKLEKLPICKMAQECISLFKNFDIYKWYNNKVNNWKILSDIMKKHNIEFLKPEDLDYNNPFSLIIKFKESEERDIVKKKLIENNIYPAILWDIPKEEVKVNEVAEILLSIHCDARYTHKNMEQLEELILKSYCK